MTWIFAAIVLVATFAIFLTTARGREVAKRIGLRNRVAGAATSEDLAYLRSACHDDPREVERRIETERARFPDLTEAEHVRRAIRRIFSERQASEAAAGAPENER
jgi:hypothetical protein